MARQKKKKCEIWNRISTGLTLALLSFIRSGPARDSARCPEASEVITAFPTASPKQLVTDFKH